MINQKTLELPTQEQLEEFVEVMYSLHEDCHDHCIHTEKINNLAETLLGIRSFVMDMKNEAIDDSGHISLVYLYTCGIEIGWRMAWHFASKERLAKRKEVM